MNKKLDTEQISTELGSSAFFKRLDSSGADARQMGETVLSENAPTGLSRAPARSVQRTPVRRVATRYAFEFYQDQIDTLRALSLAEKQAGEKGSMSEMVRAAIDDYIKKRCER